MDTKRTSSAKFWDGKKAHKNLGLADIIIYFKTSNE